MCPLVGKDINTFVESEGEYVRHLKGMRCFCVANSKGQPEAGCKHCDGSGFIYRDENTIIGLVTAISHDKKMMDTGIFYPDDCIFSPLSTDTVSEMDKIIFSWPLPYGMGDPVVRGNDDSDDLFYEAVNGIYCTDENSVVYRENTDYRFKGKTIEWTWTGQPAGSVKPSTGTRYVIKYKAYIEWIAFIPPVTRTSHSEDLGDKVILRKLHLMNKGS